MIDDSWYNLPPKGPAKPEPTPEPKPVQEPEVRYVTSGIKSKAAERGPYRRRTTRELESLLRAANTPAGLDKLLEHLTPDFLRVYIIGLDSDKQAVAMKCADVLREMKLGRVSQAPPPPDPLKNSLMVVGALPDVHSGPTVEQTEADKAAEEEEA